MTNREIILTMSKTKMFDPTYAESFKKFKKKILKMNFILRKMIKTKKALRCQLVTCFSSLSFFFVVVAVKKKSEKIQQSASLTSY